jgi:CheY-like chemotaxis protein
MSHEIRTPLNAILGYSQLMLRDPALGPPSRENLNIINRSGSHLLALINDILDMSKIEAGQMEVHPVGFDLAGLVEDLAGMFCSKAEAKALKFEVSVDPAGETSIIADEQKIRQVLTNLLGNAVKFTERGSVNMRVATRRGNATQRWLAVSVEDTGYGIAQEELSRLFQPFAQTQSGLSKQMGTGLGLAISQEFIRAMSGEITVSSTLGKGSIFSFEIPVQLGDSNISEKMKHQRVICLQPGQAVPRVLIADDEPNNRGWLNQMLSTIGFSVREAENGEAALHIWQQWKPQLILMDIRMPVLNGLEATARIKANPSDPETVVIALTANALHEDRLASLKSGADDFLSKPCHADLLLEKIREHLGVNYLYADDEAVKAQAAMAQASTLDPKLLAVLPASLIEQMKQAVLNGEKELLNELIRGVNGKDTRSATALKALADAYEYDTLMNFLEEACQ